MTDSAFTSFHLRPSQKCFLKWVLISFILLRILMVFQVPLTDTSEARYGEMARKMVESGDWIMPQFEKGVAFMGKPPLYIWLSAGGMKIFGINEFGSRIGIFTLGLAMLAGLYAWLKRLKGADYALLAACMMLMGAVLYISIGCVLADSVLWVGTTLSMIGAWNLCQPDDESPSKAGLLFFTGLAIGLLSKGPIAMVLTGIALTLWLTWDHKWKCFCSRLPWVKGALFILITVAPWYIVAEIHTPGFLKYFLWGEHVLRYLDSGWEGDLYGNAHSEPLGTIWLYALVVFLPWSLFLLPALSSPRRIWKRIRKEESGWLRYLLCWTLTPMLFFTFSGNVVPAYVLPALPAFVLLGIELFHHLLSQPSHPRASRGLQIGFGILTLVTAVIYLYLYLSLSFTVEHAKKKSHKWIAQRIQQEQKGEPYQLHIWRQRYYSAEFYTGGRTSRIDELSEFAPLAKNHQTDYLSIRKDHIGDLPPSILDHYTFLGAYRRDLLYVESDAAQKSPQAPVPPDAPTP